ncbi:hypothetical protein FA15DRAFT_706809 [Coprinopsis marcescibilis]|uniref:Uncharacterized protein n=1 Tax=Coprinopsis marcescibilis TaxID=230819 RepID=A0A5C3KN82_COPMA|nr:hypothetical protein FA15DRAFT_706809 [Coprinopsis marcescibilis]
MRNSDPQQAGCNPVDWVKTRVEELYGVAGQGSYEGDIAAQIQGTFSPGAQVIMNHEPVSLRRYTDVLQSERAATVKTDVQWMDVNEADTNMGQPEGRIVAGSFNVTRTMKFRVRVSPVKLSQRVWFSARLVEDTPEKLAIEQLFLTTSK